MSFSSNPMGAASARTSHALQTHLLYSSMSDTRLPLPPSPALPTEDPYGETKSEAHLIRPRLPAQNPSSRILDILSPVAVKPSVTSPSFAVPPTPAILQPPLPVKPDTQKSMLWKFALWIWMDYLYIRRAPDQHNLTYGQTAYLYMKRMHAFITAFIVAYFTYDSLFNSTDEISNEVKDAVLGESDSVGKTIILQFLFITYALIAARATLQNLLVDSVGDVDSKTNRRIDDIMDNAINYLKKSLKKAHNLVQKNTQGLAALTCDFKTQQQEIDALKLQVQELRMIIHEMQHPQEASVERSPTVVTPLQSRADTISGPSLFANYGSIHSNSASESTVSKLTLSNR